MSKEKKVIELKDEDLEKVSGGRKGSIGCSEKDFPECSPLCAGCPKLHVSNGIYECDEMKPAAPYMYPNPDMG